MIVFAAASNPAIRAREVRGVIRRTEGVLACLAVPRLFGVHGVDGGPSSAVAALAGARAAAASIRRALLIDCPRSEEWPAAKAVAHPIDEMSDMAHPFRIHCGGILAAHDVVGRHV